MNGIISHLNSVFVERNEAVEALALAVLARKHVVLLGPPGTAKSTLIRTFARLLGDLRVFQWQLTRFSTPEELFGPVDVSALEQGQYRRVTDAKLPEAELAYVDEVFKANSAILNSLLAIMQERVFFNNGHPTPVPLVSLIGASNEVPEEEGLEALWDRFLLRVNVGYIAEQGAFRSLLAAPVPDPDTLTPLASHDDLIAAQTAVAQVSIPGLVMDRVVTLRDEANSRGIVASDRRYVEALDLIRAMAFLDSRAEAVEDDLLVFRHILWQDPAQAREVAQLVYGVANPLLAAVQEIIEDAFAAYRQASDGAKAAGGARAEADALMEGIASLKEAKAKVAEIERQAAGRAAAQAKVDEAAKKVTAWQAELLKTLGV